MLFPRLLFKTNALTLKLQGISFAYISQLCPSLSIASAAENCLAQSCSPSQEEPLSDVWLIKDTKVWLLCFNLEQNLHIPIVFLKTGWEASVAILTSGQLLPLPNFVFLTSSQELSPVNTYIPVKLLHSVLSLRVCFHRTRFMTILTGPPCFSPSPHFPDE